MLILFLYILIVNMPTTQWIGTLGTMGHLKKLNGKISQCSSVVDIAVAIGATSVNRHCTSNLDNTKL